MSDATTDPMEQLYAPVVPIDPDPTFAARLRQRLQDALLELPGGAMTDTDSTTAEAFAWPPTLTPYIAVSDGRRALAWYTEVLGATNRGEPYVMPDGSIGHAELGIGDAVLMLAEGSSDVPVAPPQGTTFSHTLHVQVDDADTTLERARRGGARVEREPTDEPYGRVAVFVDPFGHRWMLNQPPARATRSRHGDVAYITMVVDDDERARAFYGAVLGWQFSPGSIEHGWAVEGVQPMVGLHGHSGEAAQAQLCYRVSDIAATVARVRANGGEAADAEAKPYGLLADCTDNSGTRFQLWQPSD